MPGRRGASKGSARAGAESDPGQGGAGGRGAADAGRGAAGVVAGTASRSRSRAHGTPRKEGSMPTKLNIGLTQKAAEGGGAAREASLHLELEVEPALLAEPPQLHKRIRQLFHLLRTALAEELNRPCGSTGGAHVDTAPPAASVPAPTAGKQPGAVRPATAAQVKVICAVARERGVSLAELLREQYGVGRPRDLSVRQASEVIDHLKGTGGPAPG